MMDQSQLSRSDGEANGGLSLKASRAVINGMAESTRMEDVLLGYPRAGPCPQTAHLPATPAFTHA